LAQGVPVPRKFVYLSLGPRRVTTAATSTDGLTIWMEEERQEASEDGSATDSSCMWSDDNLDVDKISALQEDADEKVGAAPMRLDDWGISAMLRAGFRLGNFAQQDLTSQSYIRHATRESDFHSYAVKTCSAAKGIDFASVFNDIKSEYELLQGLVHPSIVSVAYLFHSEHDIWLLREWCVDGSLWSYVHRHGKLEERCAFMFVDQMVEGLHYMHSKKIVHQNIQPSNLLLTRRAETLKIAGFSKAVKKECDMPIRPQREQMRELAHESKAWMAPEQICGAQKSELVDIWACGLCAGFMLLCRHPFSSKTLTSDDAANNSVLRKAVKSMCRAKLPVVLLQGLSTNAVAFLEVCLRSNPATRVSSQELRLHPVLIWNAMEKSQHQCCENRFHAFIDTFRGKIFGCRPGIQAGGDLSVNHRHLHSLTVNALPSVPIRRSKKRYHSAPHLSHMMAATDGALLSIDQESTDE